MTTTPKVVAKARAKIKGRKAIVTIIRDPRNPRPKMTRSTVYADSTYKESVGQAIHAVSFTIDRAVMSIPRRAAIGEENVPSHTIDQRQPP